MSSTYFKLPKVMTKTLEEWLLELPDNTGLELHILEDGNRVLYDKNTNTMFVFGETKEQIIVGDIRND